MNKVVFLEVDGVLDEGISAIEMLDKGISDYYDDLLSEPSSKQLKNCPIRCQESFIILSEFKGRLCLIEPYKHCS